ncbi:NACHT N-terminal Helical domain 1-containing protein [Streptomyces bauhiniae]|uniref:NACHT N-terminal Helical domain 1-containing protein n=1 Tax=Streptomyces bauhiniae TaxID=2340725 RepID=UPI003454B836
MEPTAIGGKVASGLLTSLLKKVFPADGPGARLVPKPVRLGGRVSLGGEKRHLGERELRRLAAHLVDEALATPGEPPFARDERTAVIDALTRRLLALGEIDMDAVQSVGLDERGLAGQLDRAVPRLDGLSGDAELFLERATEWACGQILEFFSRRSTFVARTVVEQSRAQARTAAGVEELLVRTRRPDNPRPRLRDPVPGPPGEEARPAHHLRHRPHQFPGALAAGRRVSEPGGGTTRQ